MPVDKYSIIEIAEDKLNTHFGNSIIFSIIYFVIFLEFSIMAIFKSGIYLIINKNW